MEMHIIAHIHTPFPDKFGIPRQSMLVPQLRSQIVFEPEYRVPEAFRGIDGFSHLWLVWQFSESVREKWSPTVRPPRLGGNKRLGVFATRSPFRPNPIGLSCVELLDVQLHTPQGPVLTVGGADLMDGTPIFDIKPYLPYADAFPDAKGGFAAPLAGQKLEVRMEEDSVSAFTPEERGALREILSQDPRPHYQNDAGRIYGFPFAGREVHFTVAENILTVLKEE